MLRMHPDKSYLKTIESVKFDPIFILGLHRSGTSVLYKMLTASGCFNPVTVYHLISYNHLLDDYKQNNQETNKTRLSKSFQNHGLDNRGIDALKISADFAEEYGFFLDEQSAQSHLTKHNVSQFTQLCKKIITVTDATKPILLKNPYDFSRFIFIKKVFPNAKFVFIHRHPLKVLSSLINAVRVLFSNHNYYASQISRIYNKIYENPLSRSALQYLTTHLSIFGLMLLTTHASVSTRYYLKHIHKLPDSCYLSITYEDLCNHPQQTIENIFSTLHIQPQTPIDYTSFIKPRKTTLDPTVFWLQKYILHSMKPYCTQFNYTLENYQ